MEEKWIAKTADSEEQTRVVRLNEIEDGVAVFAVLDIERGGEEITTEVVADAFQHEEDIPDKYTGFELFDIVDSDTGEFEVIEYNHFTGKETNEQYKLALKFDKKLTEEYKAYVESL